MADQKLSALSTGVLAEITEFYLNASGSRKATMENLRNFLLGESAREAVVAATTGAITLATDVETGDTLDGVTLATGDRILVKDQAAGEENGIYTVNSAAPPTRATDFDVDGEALRGATFSVIDGTANAQTWWMHTTTGAITLGTTALVFAQVGGGGSYTSLTDTPSSFAAQSRKITRVNDAENAIEFVGEHHKEPVRVATTANGDLATAYEDGDSVDGVALSTGDRILLKDQTAPSENGIWIVAASGAPTRAPDMDDDPDVIIGMTVAALQGTVNANTLFQLTTTGTITLDTTGLTFVQVGGAGGGGTFTSLSDTPASYSGQGGKSVVVKTAEDGVEFVAAKGQQPFKGAKVKLSGDLTSQNISGGVSIAFDAEDYDTDAFHDNVTNPSRLTVPAGVTRVRLSANAWIGLATSDQWFLGSITKNGVTDWDGLAIGIIDVTSTNHYINLATGIVEVVEGDYFEFDIQTAGDTSVTIGASRTWFAMQAVETIAPAATPRGVLARSTAVQSVASSTNVPIEWDAEEYDTDAIHDNVTNNTRFVVPAGVTKVRLKCNMQWASLVLGPILWLEKNGTDFEGSPREQQDNGTMLGSASPILDVVGGDYFEWVARQSTGTINIVNGFWTWASMEIVEPAIVAGGAGKQTLWLPAGALTPTVSNGCGAPVSIQTTAGQPDQHVCAFDPAADEHAQFDIGLPKSWDLGTLSFQPVWTHQGGQTGGLDGVAWALQGISIASQGAFAQAYGAAIVVLDDQSAADQVHIAPESAPITLAGSPAEGEVQFFRVFRDVSDGADDLDIDAQLVGLWLHFTTDKATDD